MKRLAYRALGSEIQPHPGGGRVLLALRQTGGVTLEACVEPGQKVERGQQVGKAAGGAAAVHSSLTGEVRAILQTVAGDGTLAPTVEVEGESTSAPQAQAPMQGDVSDLSAQALQARLREAGVIPLGGNGRNSDYAALQGVEEAPEVLLVLCADEEILLQTQRTVLQEDPARAIEGATLVQRAVGARRLVFAASADQKDLVSGETIWIGKAYPDGLPELLMHKVTGRFRLGEGRPRPDVYVINVETAVAAQKAVREGLPVVDKVVTVGQEGAAPIVLRVPLGTPFSALLEKAGLAAEDGDRLFTGGPLRGTAQFDPEAPVTKGTDGLFLQKGRQVCRYDDVACIGCGACIRVCPMKIPVSMMTRNCEFGRVPEAVDYDLESCIECGLCAYVCTARRPLLQYILFAKQEKQKLETA